MKTKKEMNNQYNDAFQECIQKLVSLEHKWINTDQSELGKKAKNEISRLYLNEMLKISNMGIECDRVGLLLCQHFRTWFEVIPMSLLDKR